MTSAVSRDCPPATARIPRLCGPVSMPIESLIPTAMCRRRSLATWPVVGQAGSPVAGTPGSKGGQSAHRYELGDIDDGFGPVCRLRPYLRLRFAFRVSPTMTVHGLSTNTHGTAGLHHAAQGQQRL
ncbi:unnamed protein product [Parajaminaea phylloscopi]